MTAHAGTSSSLSSTKSGAPGGGEQRIAHFTSMSLSDAWHPVGLVSEDKGKGVPVPLVKVIDPEVQKLPSGTSIHLKLVPSFPIFLLFCFPGFYHP